MCIATAFQDPFARETHPLFICSAQISSEKFDIFVNRYSLF